MVGSRSGDLAMAANMSGYGGLVALSSVFRVPRRSAPWLGVAAICVASSLTVAPPLSSAVATRSVQPGTTIAQPSGSPESGVASADTGSLSTPNARPSTDPTAAAATATSSTPVAPPRRGGAAATRATGPSGCCATGGAAQGAGLFEDLEFLTGSALSSRLDQYAAIGARVARFQLIWENVQPAGASTYDWQYIDAVISGLTARGIEPLPVIDTTPPWARSAGCTAHVCAPADPDTYATFAAAAAARYAPMGVHQWEIWNEPNISMFWQPAPSSAAYTALLKAAYTAIHRADPAATVISGGLAPTATQDGRIAPVQFLSEIYADGGAGYFDAVGWHPYAYPAPPSSSADTGWSEMFGTTPNVRSLMVANGDGAKRVWGTEFGAPTCTGDATCVSEAGQAQIITQAYALWRSYPWTGPLISYMYQDTGTDESNRENHFGFVRYDGTQKPAYAAFRAAALA
jgi:hypothetical protein